MKCRLSDGSVIQIDLEDYYKYVAGKSTRISKSGYVLVSGEGLLHRLIMGELNGHIVDHIDRDPLNNSRANLRLATKSTNAMNRPKPKSNTSGYKGVRWNKERKLWDANIQVDKVNRFLGRYDTPQEAAKVYDYHARILHKDFAYLNFPDEVYSPPTTRRKSRRGGTSKYKGVTYVKKSGKFSARCRVAKFYKFLGEFSTDIEAARAYDEYVIACGIPEYANHA